MKQFYAVIFILLFSAGAAFAQTGRGQGIALYEKGEYKNAVSVLKNASKSSTQDAQIWYYLGLSYVKLDDKKAAQSALEKASALAPKDASVRATLAFVYMLRGKRQEADAEARAALELNPKNSIAHYVSGVISYRADSFSGAYESAKAAIEIDANFASAYLLKSQALVSSFAAQTGTVLKSAADRNRLLAEATADLEKYLALAPGGKDAEFYREYAKSLRFFADYYNQAENQKTLDAEDVGQADKSVRTPIKIISKPQAKYTNATRNEGIEGTVRLLVGFGADAKIVNILIISSPDYRLSEVAIEAARAIKFEPPTKDGKPVAAVRQIMYSFNIY